MTTTAVAGPFLPAVDTRQQAAILKTHRMSQVIRARYPVNTRVEAVAGPGSDVVGSGRFGTVRRHVPGVCAQGGYLVVVWDDGVEGRHQAGSLRGVR